MPRKVIDIETLSDSTEHESESEPERLTKPIKTDKPKKVLSDKQKAVLESARKKRMENIEAAKKNKKKTIVLWGTGKPMRELMYVDDLADACIYFMNKKTKETLINIGTSSERSILNYARFVFKKLNLKCRIILDKSKPDGTPRKIIDSSIALNYGWFPKINLDRGFDLTVKSFYEKSDY